MRILLVEDDAVALQLFQEALTDHDYVVDTATNGEEALHKARQQAYDLVITDIRMPGTSGLDALEEVKAMHPMTKSIVVTGYASEQETLKAIQIGVGEYLTKPFRLTELLQAVKRQLTRLQEEEEERQQQAALRSTLMWLLRAYIADTKVSRGSWVLESGKWARLLGQQLGLPPEEQETLSLATIIVALRKVAPNLLPPFLFASLPAGVRALLEFSADSGLSPEAVQIVEAAQQMARTSLAPAQQPLEAADETQHRSRRGLLQVALSLEAAGDQENAARAFEELRHLGPSHEAALAGLGAARVAWKSGRGADTAALAQQAYLTARAVGPLSQHQVAAPAGILLALTESGEAQAVLGEAHRLAQGLGQAAPPILVLAEALFFGSGSLSASLREATLALTPLDLSHNAFWLLPRLLASPSARTCDEIYGLLTAVFRAEPGLASACLRDPHLQPSLRELCQRTEDREFLNALGYNPEGAAPVTSPTPARRSLRVLGLGRMEFFVDGKRVPEANWKRHQKAKLLLYRLCLEPHRAFTDEALIEEIWPGQAHAGKANLNALRATLRATLRGEEGPEGFDYILRESSGTRIHPDCEVFLDVNDLLEALQKARQSRGETFEKLHLSRVVELYSGPFLESVGLPWAVATRKQLQQGVVEALLRISQLAQETQHYDQVVECAQRILQFDPCHQEAYRSGMMAYLSSGRPEQAVRLFEQCKQNLKRQLEMEPSIELLSIYHRARLSVA